MTLEQFIELATDEVRKYVKDEAYISKLKPDMERRYNESVRLIPILGSQQISPTGYALGISLLYPDMPPTYD